jgi:hypothetical protein
VLLRQPMRVEDAPPPPPSPPPAMLIRKEMPGGGGTLQTGNKLVSEPSSTKRKRATDQERTAATNKKGSERVTARTSHRHIAKAKDLCEAVVAAAGQQCALCARTLQHKLPDRVAAASMREPVRSTWQNDGSSHMHGRLNTGTECNASAGTGDALVVEAAHKRRFDFVRNALCAQPGKHLLKPVPGQAVSSGKAQVMFSVAYLARDWSDAYCDSFGASAVAARSAGLFESRMRSTWPDDSRSWLSADSWLRTSEQSA